MWPCPRQGCQPGDQRLQSTLSHCPGRAEAGEPHRAQKSREPRTGERAGRRPASPGLPAAPEQCSGTGLLPTISGPRVCTEGLLGRVPRVPHRPLLWVPPVRATGRGVQGSRLACHTSSW